MGCSFGSNGAVRVADFCFKYGLKLRENEGKDEDFYSDHGI